MEAWCMVGAWCMVELWWKLVNSSRGKAKDKRADTKKVRIEVSGEQ